MSVGRLVHNSIEETELKYLMEVLQVSRWDFVYVSEINTCLCERSFLSSLNFSVLKDPVDHRHMKPVLPPFTTFPDPVS